MQEKTTFFITYVFLFIFSTPLFAQNIDYQWVKQIDGTGSEFVKSSTTDIEGNVYTTGPFQNTADFNPGNPTSTLTSFGMADMFFIEIRCHWQFPSGEANGR
ncbi:hypothetical protein [Gelidibacter gilvus]|uniref:T9SS C-terminal target domain-containing protein n=1 Tax=Gelidibacter gilvus TaxID=59602 RepID=A0A4Q0XG32_9FLAO|nr:hypothetical protein [Gelidibacter gilvus]RXJ50190.1 hypothetical protein ESZ48_09415 [Gelidibacter gilvus]